MFQDRSQRCRDCKFSCDDMFAQHLPRVLGTRPADGNKAIHQGTKLHEINKDWSYKLNDYDPITKEPKAKAEELRQFRWCKYMDSKEGELIVGQGTPIAHNTGGAAHLVFAPGPVQPRQRQWRGPGLVMNMEQFAFLHGNPTPIFSLPVDWSLLGDSRTKRWVGEFAKSNSFFEKTFASAWKKVASAGWDAAKKPKLGHTGGKLETCRNMPCTAKGGKFWCPVDILNDRLRYLPKPASLRLELGECLGGDPEDSVMPGACVLVGGFGVRGTVKCGDKTYQCCSEKACEWEKWLKKHREADMSEEPTCPYTKADKDAEVKKTVKAWRTGIDGNGKGGHETPEELGIDYMKTQVDADNKNRRHFKQAMDWYKAKYANRTLPLEFSCDWSGGGGRRRTRKCFRWQRSGNALEWLRVNAEIGFEKASDFYTSAFMRKPV